MAKQAKREEEKSKNIKRAVIQKGEGKGDQRANGKQDTSKTEEDDNDADDEDDRGEQREKKSY